METERDQGVNPPNSRKRTRRSFLFGDLPALVLVALAACSKLSPSTTRESPRPSPAPSSPTPETSAPTTDTLPPPTTEPAAEILPSEVLDLTDWKITLPTGPPEHPREITQPALATYAIDPWFVVTPDGKGVRFRAPVTGVTTKGSKYPRSELREMSNNSKASWSSTKGTHTMFLDQAITAVPHTKQHVVAGQIHASDHDVIVIRLEYPNLYVNVDGKNERKLDSNYILGTRFQVKFVVEGGETKVYYNKSEKPVYTLKKGYSGAYFKAGAYPQSNCDTEKDLSLCNDNNFGEVILYQLAVTHQ